MFVYEIMYVFILPVLLYVCMNGCAYVCICLWLLFVYVYVCMCLFNYGCICVRMYVYMCRLWVYGSLVVCIDG